MGHAAESVFDDPCAIMNNEIKAMAIKKHHLSIGADHITGSAGKDLFIGPLHNGAPTLSNDDVLNGKAGADRIVAALVGTSAAPQLKNIEKGLFSWSDGMSFELDLTRARQMTDITIRNVDAGQTARTFSIEDAAHLSAFTLLDSHANFELGGIDTSLVTDVELRCVETDGSKLSVSTFRDAPLSKIDVTLDSSNVELSIDAKVSVVDIHSTGDFSNYVYFSHPAGVDQLRKMTIDGGADIDVGQLSEFSKLKTVDASGGTGIISADFDSAALLSYKGGTGSDRISLSQLGGTVAHPTKISLGVGADSFSMNGSALDSDILRIEGGAGFDEITAYGTASKTAGLLSSVESLSLQQAGGVFDLHGSGVEMITFWNPAMATTLSGLQSGAEILFSMSQTTAVQFLLDGAAKSQTDSLTAKFQDTGGSHDPFGGPIVIGSSTDGLSAPDLSVLNIESDSSVRGSLMLGSVGGKKNPLTINIAGDDLITIGSTDSAVSYITNIKIDNDAGVNLIALSWGLQSFDSGGATVVGGKGNDVLVGGAGEDLLKTRGGDNEVYGSQGADTVVLQHNAGLDVLYYTNVNQSQATGAVDIIREFTVTDTIDIHTIVDNVVFKGNFDSFAEGLESLSTSVSSAFFNKADHSVYVDLDHNGVIGVWDLGVQLEGVESIQSWNLVA
jgi:Ca2+-binding RTX toxin-like protein